MYACFIGKDPDRYKDVVESIKEFPMVHGVDEEYNPDDPPVYLIYTYKEDEDDSCLVNSSSEPDESLESTKETFVKVLSILHPREKLSDVLDKGDYIGAVETDEEWVIAIVKFDGDQFIGADVIDASDVISVNLLSLDTGEKIEWHKEGQ